MKTYKSILVTNGVIYLSKLDQAKLNKLFNCGSEIKNITCISIIDINQIQIMPSAYPFDGSTMKIYHNNGEIFSLSEGDFSSQMDVAKLLIEKQIFLSRSNFLLGVTITRILYLLGYLISVFFLIVYGYIVSNKVAHHEKYLRSFSRKQQFFEEIMIKLGPNNILLLGSILVVSFLWLVIVKIKKLNKNPLYAVTFEKQPL